MVTRTRSAAQSHELHLIAEKRLSDSPHQRPLILAMGSTTGGLWTSADAGESWRAIDARMPPIAALKFA
jgi:hypothetical protein